jgi:hypothetical protein
MAAKHALRRAVAPNVFEAFRTLVFRGDVPTLAAQMGLKPGTLYNKADAGDDTHSQPTLRDVVLATQATGDLRVVEALAEMFGRATFDCAQHESTSDEALLDLVTNLAAESGDFHRELGHGLREKRFSAESLRVIRGEAFDIVSALMTLVRRLEDYVDVDEA